MRNKGSIARGAVYGAVAGIYFGTLAVMVDAASDRVSSGGFHALIATPRGLVPLASIALLGTGGIILTQVSFQVGALAATLPANLAADPVTGVVFGAILLREYVPTDTGHVMAYALCLAAVIVGAMRLAQPAAAARTEFREMPTHRRGADDREQIRQRNPDGDARPNGERAADARQRQGDDGSHRAAP